jgi:hypothetical protein
VDKMHAAYRTYSSKHSRESSHDGLSGEQLNVGWHDNEMKLMRGRGTSIHTCGTFATLPCRLRQARWAACS